MTYPVCPHCGERCEPPLEFRSNDCWDFYTAKNVSDHLEGGVYLRRGDPIPPKVAAFMERVREVERSIQTEEEGKK